MDIVEVGMDKEHVERHVLSREEVIPGHMLALEVRSSSVSKREVGDRPPYRLVDEEQLMVAKVVTTEITAATATAAMAAAAKEAVAKVAMV